MPGSLLYKLVDYILCENFHRSQRKQKLLFLISVLALLEALDWNILLER